MFDAHDLLVLTKSEAEDALAAVEAMESAAPHNGDAPSDSFRGTVATCAGKFEQLGWEQRAADLDEALQHEHKGMDGTNGTNGTLPLGGAWDVRLELRQVDARWHRVSNLHDPDVVLGAGKDLAPVLKLIVEHSTELTAYETSRQEYESIRRDLEAQLKLIAVGRALDFNVVFADRIPKADDRSALLKKLADDVAFVGAVDASRGLVFRTSDSTPFRVFTYVSPLIFFAVAFGVLVAAASLHYLISGIPTKLGPPWYKLIGPYVLVCVGVVIHLVVANVKEQQAGTAINAIADWLTWLHLRWAGLALSYFHVVVVVIGLRLLGIGDTGHDVTLWIAAGYSVDSIAGMILNRFANGSSATTQLTKLVSASPTNAG